MAQPSQARRFLTTSQAAEVLGVSAQTVVNLANSGDLPCWRLPRSKHRRFRPADVEKLLEPETRGAA